MKKLNPEARRKELEHLAALPDNLIDTSDIPELSDDELNQMRRGLMYRPMKNPVTMRLDADVIAWLKEDGKGYQTKANALLRREMIRARAEKKKPAAVAPSVSKRRKTR